MIFGELTSPQIGEVDRDLVVLLPLGAMEQHGPHLPLLTDTVIVEALAERVEKLEPGQVLRLPTLWLGYSPHHVGFAGTLTAAWDVYIHLLMSVLSPIVDLGFRRILVLNAHGGNRCPAEIALRELRTRFRDAEGLWLTMMSEWQAMADAYHACAVETSLLAHLRPDLVAKGDVRTNTLELGSAFYSFDPESPVPDRVFLAYAFGDATDTGILGSSPAAASAEQGKKVFERMVGETIAFVNDFRTWRYGKRRGSETSR
ncbi:creatininase family protein [Candidatus Poribacteria bacterium]|nr:creatininase family protein [Candidatus Poribacteria bacterium]